MDSDTAHDSDGSASPHEEAPRRELPHDLPKTLDDRRQATLEAGEEYYDAWQQQAHYITTPTPAKPLAFNLALDEPADDADLATPGHRTLSPNPLLAKMLAAQSKHREDGAGANEDAIAADTSMTEADKGRALQKALHMAASNGDDERVERLLEGAARKYLDINGPDDEGAAPLIYASCFGHDEIVRSLLDAGARVDEQDRHKWTALMWATANRHASIVKLLLERGASPELTSSSGRTAFDFVPPDSDISEYLHENGYQIGTTGIGGGDDFYRSGFSQDRFEEEMAENEMRRRMAMESAMNLEVDLGNLGLDEQPETPGEIEDGQDFVWDRCLHDQMFVFQESEMSAILDIIITNMQPQRSPSQKPVPANILFLGARYAHYHAHPELLAAFLGTALDKIDNVIEHHYQDMTMQAFWMSNMTLLLHYLKKDPGTMQATAEYQLHIAEMINEIFVLIIRDAERRIDGILDTAMLDHETIPGLQVDFQSEWKIFKSKKKIEEPESLEKRVRPESPKKRAKIAPRNVTSLLSSTLFVMDLYDVHSVITAQVLAQLLYWIGSELFNRIISNKKYLARTKAMQIRMNVSVVEEWARNNNRQPEHYENGSTIATGETTVDAARQSLAPVVQLLQWLQIFSALGDNPEALETTIQQMTRLSPQQLTHAVKNYRAEVGEGGLPKPAMKRLQELQRGFAERKARRKSALNPSKAVPAPANVADEGNGEHDAEDDIPEHLLMDPSLMLAFTLPTSTDMLIGFGAGFGGINRERERKYTPTVPAEFLAKLDLSGAKNSSVYEGQNFDNDDEDDDDETNKEEEQKKEPEEEEN